MTTLATPPAVRDRHFIGGEWAEPSTDERIDVVNPFTEEVMGSIPAGTAEDVDRAVAAAREAFEGWSQTSPYERAGYLAGIAAGLAARAEELAALISSELGMPIKPARAAISG